MAIGDVVQDLHERHREALGVAGAWFAQQLIDAPGSDAARDYLASRALDADAAARFGIGFAPRDPQALSRYLGSLGFDEAQQRDAGLLAVRERDGSTYARFRNRIMFPIHDETGRLVGFGGRTIGDGEPKYLNSPTSAVFQKGRTLYGFHDAANAMRRRSRVIVVEGYFDRIRLVLAGIEEVVAPLGTALTAEHARLLRGEVKDVFLMYDRDEAGQKATVGSACALLQQKARVHVVTLPVGEDPDTFVRAQGAAALDVSLRAAVDVFDHHLQAVRDRGAFVDVNSARQAMVELLPIAAAAIEPATRGLYLARLAGASGIDQAVLAREVEEVERTNTARGAVARADDEALPLQPTGTSNAPHDDDTTPIVTGPVFSSADCYGPLGDFVRAWEPYTEASPVSLYTSAIAALGALVGRDVFMPINGTGHATRFYVVLVGPSGRGRKGTALGIVRRLIETLDPEFARSRVHAGLSTTEGLVQLVRDEVPERVGQNGRVIPAIPGVDDKRLLIIEDEMASPFRVMRREGNDLSAALRSAWDGESLQRVTKGDPARATSPHLNILGAITPSELRSSLQVGDVLNGFANRLLPIYTTSERLCPRGGSPTPQVLGACSDGLRDAVQWARARRGGFRMSDAAWAEWERTHYPRLARPDERSDTLRALQERGAPYVLRLALLFALLDRVAAIEPVHLAAAHTLWSHVVATWRVVFTDTIARSPLAAKIEEGLRRAGPEGLSRTQLRKEVVRSNNVEGPEITAALQELAGDGLVVRFEAVRASGRPAEMWRHAWCQPTAHRAGGSTGGMGAMGGVEAAPPSLLGETPIAPIPPKPPTASTPTVNGEGISPNPPISPYLPSGHDPDDFDSIDGWRNGGEAA